MLWHNNFNTFKTSQYKNQATDLQYYHSHFISSFLTDFFFNIIIVKIFSYLIYQLYFNSRLVQCFKLLGIFSQKTMNNCFQLFISYSRENKQHIFNQSANNEVVTYCILHITYCLDERNMNMKFRNSIRNASIRKVG